MADTLSKNRYHVFLIKPSKYDDDGYVISWSRGVITSNSLACINALTEDVRDREVLGPDVDVVIHCYDEMVQPIPVKKLCRDLKKTGERGILCLVGVQTNQYARAVDMAREFRSNGIPAMIGGFHVSGSIEMLPDLPPEIKEASDEGITLVAGEVEVRWPQLLKDAYEGNLEPIYNFVNDKPALENVVPPFLPNRHLKSFMTPSSSVDAGRGCPFHCSFCTIINIQGNDMRGRSADDIEKLLRISLAQGIDHIFITDDNFARHKHWEEIVDRIIYLKEEKGLGFVLQIQVDTVAHKIPNFIEKLTRAGCRRVFIGLETVNPDNLKATGKYQNQLKEYRVMLQKWHEYGALTYAGYIIGFPGDTYESIMRDVEFLKRELPLDFAEFFIMTPLPGSKDHQGHYLAKVPMEADTNLYDTMHVCMKHPKMSNEELMRAYDDAWKSFYSNDHMMTLMKRHKNRGKRRRVMLSLVWFCNSVFVEGIHPLLGGFIRMKGRRNRRPGFPRENALIYYPKRFFELIGSLFALLALVLKLCWLWNCAAKAANAGYMDEATTPVVQPPKPERKLIPVGAAS
ncbi:MAG: radical SAM protein [Candidatus Omnitrophota bacterium]|nr:radical SAM protein [Candidatus Omnitrophota bacterium]